MNQPPRPSRSWAVPSPSSPVSPAEGLHETVALPVGGNAAPNPAGPSPFPDPAGHPGRAGRPDPAVADPRRRAPARRGPRGQAGVAAMGEATTFRAEPLLRTKGHRQASTAVVGLVTFAVALAGIRLAHGTPLAVLSGLALLGVVPGCGVTCWVPVQDRLLRILSIVAASLTWSTLLCTALAWRQAVTPGTVLWGSAGAGAALCALFLLVRLARRREVPEQRAPRIAWYRTALREEPDGEIDLRRFAAMMLVAMAGLLLLLSLVLSRGKVVGDYGLLPVLGWSFVASVVLGVGVAVWAMIYRVHGVAASATALVVLALNATPAILVSTALASWNYKHFGVVDVIVQQWPLSDPLDAYQQWPGFFATAAGLVQLSGVNPMGYANWAQPFYELLNALALYTLARRLAPRHPGVPYVAVLIFVASAWEGQRYYAPQTHAFLLTLLLFLFSLPLMEPHRLRFAPLWDWPRRNTRAYYSKPEWYAAPVALRGRRAAALMVGLLCVYAAIVVTHQLSPYMILFGLGMLWVLGVMRRTWLLLAMTVVLVSSFVKNWAIISLAPTFTGFSFLNLKGGALEGQSSPAQELASQIAQPIGITLWLVSFVCILSYRRHMRDVVVVAALAAAPFALVLVGNYGGEAIYRVFLFTSPFCALIIAMRLADLRKAPLFRWMAVGTWTALVALGSCQAQGFGLLPLVFVPDGEITASAYFLDHAPKGSSLVLAGSNFPSRLNARYTLHNPTSSPNDPSFSEVPDLRGSGLKKLTDRQIAEYVDRLAKGSGFLVISRTMYSYDRYYGIFDPGVLDDLTKRVTTSKYFKLFYQTDGVIILEARP